MRITGFWLDPLFFSYWLPPILWGITILGMSGDWGEGKNTYLLTKWLLSWFVDLKPAQIVVINFYLRKTGHAMAYGLMYFLWFRAFRAQTGRGPGRACIWSLGLCLIFALMDEGRQWFHPSRGASLSDVILDMSGASLAALITSMVWPPKPKAPAISGIAGRPTMGPQ